jgi:hypothetical protein
MAVRLMDGLGGLAQVVGVAALVRHARERLGGRLADAVLAIGDNRLDGHGQGLTHLDRQRPEVLAGGREQAPGQQDLAGKAIAQHPQAFVADVGPQAIDSQGDAAPLAGEGVQPRDRRWPGRRVRRSGPSGCCSRSRRGSAWTDDGWASRSAFRQRFEPERRYDHIGFRVAAVRP